MVPLHLVFKTSDWHWTGSGDPHPGLDPTSHFRLFFFETVSPSEMEVAALPNTPGSAGRVKLSILGVLSICLFNHKHM